MLPKNKGRPTLNDVAQKVGVTKMTVSRFLRNPSDVSENTREKIAAVIDELGFVASRVPDILSNRHSKAIGILLPSLSNQVFANLLHGIESVTRPKGYQTLITHYGYSVEDEEEKIASLLSYHVDGLILTESVHSERSYKMLKASKVPVVETIDLPENPIDMAVGLDHKQAAYDMVSKMIALGRRFIVYFAARLDRRTQLRCDGYIEAMKNNGLKPRIFSTQAHSSFTQGRKLMQQALLKYPQLDGIFCTNDDLAIGAMMHCQTHNIEIPNKIAVAGFNALDIGKAISPSLASVKTPRREIGVAAAALLLAKLSGKKIAKPVQNIGYELYLGESI